MEKKQALAAMDAHMVRVSAEHLRLTERRQRFMLRLYPVLKHAPPDERLSLLRDARRHTFRQWTVYVVLSLTLIVAALLLRTQLLERGTEAQVAAILQLVVLGIAPPYTVLLYMRSYLKSAVGRPVPAEYGKPG